MAAAVMPRQNHCRARSQSRFLRTGVASRGSALTFEILVYVNEPVSNEPADAHKWNACAFQTETFERSS